MSIGVAGGGAKEAMAPQKLLENIATLCFERRFPKQNSVIRLKSNILPTPQIFVPLQTFGLATPLDMSELQSHHCIFEEINHMRTVIHGHPKCP